MHALQQQLDDSLSLFTLCAWHSLSHDEWGLTLRQANASVYVYECDCLCVRVCVDVNEDRRVLESIEWIRVGKKSKPNRLVLCDGWCGFVTHYYVRLCNENSFYKFTNFGKYFLTRIARRLRRSATTQFQCGSIRNTKTLPLIFHRSANNNRALLCDRLKIVSRCNWKYASK